MTTFKPIVMSGPSGCGKSTLLTRLMKEFPDCFSFSVSRKLCYHLVNPVGYVIPMFLSLATSFKGHRNTGVSVSIRQVTLLDATPQ